MPSSKEFGMSGNGTQVFKRDMRKSSEVLNDVGESASSNSSNDSNNNNRSSSTNCIKRGAASFFGSSKKWIVFRFAMIFLISVVILCCVYGLKSTTKHKNNANSADVAYSVGDNVYAGDLWLVIELESNGRGLRTALGKAVAAHVCSAIKASQAIGWTPLVVGGKSICCRSSSCRHLHPQDLKLMKYATTSYFLQKDDFSSAMKAAAFLAAIKRGARFIFHANPEVYYKAGVTPEQYQQQLEYQLKKTTLGVSVGLVKGRELEASHYFNPYLHFVPNMFNITEKDSNRYKICETRPPSIEKFLDSDGRSMDMSAPPLTLPGKISSPFDSRNTAFARNSFWALLVLPDIKAPRSTRTENDRAIYMFRSILAQTILAETGGSTKFSSSHVATVDDIPSSSSMEGMTPLISFLNEWQCSKTTAVGCIKDLGKDLVALEMLSKANLDVIELWATDLTNVGYEDVTASADSLDPLYPCVGQDALVGVYFHPSLIEAKRRIIPNEDPVSEELRHPKSSFRRLASRSSHAVRMIQRLCPSVDIGYLTTSISKKFNKHENLVLIVTFSDKQYQNLPLMEVLYRHHFKNMLYCGEPDETLEQYRDMTSRQGFHFSFLPTHRHAGYECLLGALEMGYNVDGFLIVDQNTLINSWNFEGIDPLTIWHGNDHATNITVDNIKTIDPEEKVILKSAHGILKAFQFLEEVLLSARNTTTTITAAPSTSHVGSGGDVSNLVAIKHSLFKRQTESEDTTEASTETSTLYEFEATTVAHEDQDDDNNGDGDDEDEVATDRPLEISDRSEVEFGPESKPFDDITDGIVRDNENLSEDEAVALDQDYSEEEINIATQIQSEELGQIEGSGDANITIDVTSIISEPEKSPSIIEELETELVPQKQDFKISLFGELTKDEPGELEAEVSDDSALEPEVGEDGEIIPATIPPIVFPEVEESIDTVDSSNQSVTVVQSTDTSHANELLFHPANFINVDENENVEPSAEETVIEPVVSESDDKSDDFTNLMADIQKLYKNINEKLNLWVHFKKYQSSLTIDEIAEVRAALENLQCDVSTNTEICNLVAIFFKTLQSNEGDQFQLFHDNLPVYYVPASFKDKLYLMANLFTKFSVADELAFPLLFRGLSHTSTWSKLTHAEMETSTEKSSYAPKSPQDLWLFNDDLDDQSQFNDLEEAHYLYPVDMKSVLTNEGLRNVICRNF